MINIRKGMLIAIILMIGIGVIINFSIHLIFGFISLITAIPILKICLECYQIESEIEDLKAIQKENEKLLEQNFIPLSKRLEKVNYPTS